MILLAAVLVPSAACKRVREEVGDAGGAVLDLVWGETVFAQGVTQDAVMNLQLGLSEAELLELLGSPLDIKTRGEMAFWIYGRPKPPKEA